MNKTQLAQQQKLAAAEKALRKAKVDLQRTLAAIYKEGTPVGVIVKAGQNEITPAVVVIPPNPFVPEAVRVRLDTAKPGSRLATRLLHYSKVTPTAWLKGK